MSENNENNASLLKVDLVRKSSYANSIFLREGDIIIALNNEFFVSGEKVFTETLQDCYAKGKKSLLTIIRNNVFLEIIISRSLGCKFVTTDIEETKRLKELFSKKTIYDQDELTNFSVLRDLKFNYDVIKDEDSIWAGFFPPLWLAYENQWWILGFLTTLSMLLISVNFWIFLLGWIIFSIYCHKCQSNLLRSFSLLSGKGFSLIIASKNIHEAQKTIRLINPKAKFKYTKLEDEIDNNNNNEAHTENIIEKNADNKKINSQDKILV
tara:strand:- start:7129 stop:7929 length:801 start_codon:yes stop_codon:yes gene_type:complete